VFWSVLSESPAIIEAYKTKRVSALRVFVLSKEKLLDVVAAEAAICAKCELWKTRKNVVSGEGSPKSKIMFIGEAPGRSEDLEGKPFVGAAGKLLTALLSDIGYRREDVFICNVVKCRPPENREPSSREAQTCTPYLDRQIKAIMPKVIVTLGNYSTAHTLSKFRLSFNGITQTHGKLHKTSLSGVPVTLLPTFHPAAALYSGKYRALLQQDFELLRRELMKKGLVGR
jgi:DNA polymerase